LRSILNNGAFTVRRTDHQFSRLPVDLTLEQTVNAHAASRTSGITSVTNSYSTRLRWMTIKSARAAFVSKVQEMIGMTKTEDVTSDLTPARLQRNAEDLQKVMNHIRETHNPFTSESDKDQLINISTGKVASEGVKKFLLSIPKMGQEKHKEFIKACQENPQRFEEPIKRVKLLTFQDECALNKRTSNKKVQELRCTRDLMGRLAVVASQRQLDLEAIFSYPLTPVPLCLFAGDGTMIKTEKSTLLKELEKRVEPSPPPSSAAYIIDGNFLLHLMPSNKAAKYGKLARIILLQALSCSKDRVDLVFDRYTEPSIKDSERGRRGTLEQLYVITGTEQRCPQNLQEALKSKSFKINLPLFLVNEWEHQEYADALDKCHLYVGVEDNCYHFFVEDKVVKKETVLRLKCNHDEADTRVCLHAKDADRSTDNLVIRASDTDIAIVMLYHSHKFTAKIWMDVGISSKNSRRLICLTDIANSLGRQLCASLQAFHAYSGCDYTSAFVRKGKVRPFKLLEKEVATQQAFSNLAITEAIDEDIYRSIEMFTCRLYGAKRNPSSINEYRYCVVEKAYGPRRNSKNLLEKLCGIDGCNIPPCNRELKQHVHRSAFAARMWANADSPEVIQRPRPADGWEISDGVYEPTMFKGPQIPEELLADDIQVMNDDESDEVDDRQQFSYSDDSSDSEEDID
jgi:hypothetical protein